MWGVYVIKDSACSVNFPRMTEGRQASEDL